MSVRVAPSARRMPICLVRWATQKLASPTMPSAVTSSIAAITATSSPAMARSVWKYFSRSEETGALSA